MAFGESSMGINVRERGIWEAISPLGWSLAHLSGSSQWRDGRELSLRAASSASGIGHHALGAYASRRLYGAAPTNRGPLLLDVNELKRREATKRGMRSCVVVPNPPVIERGLSLLDATELMPVQKLPADDGIECLDPGVAGKSLRVLRFNLVATHPILVCATDELASSIRADHVGNPSIPAELIEDFDQALYRRLIKA